MPSFVDAERARAWTEHPSANLRHVAAQQWSGNANRWIVMAAGTSQSGRGLDIRLALLEVTGPNTSQPLVSRLARSTEPLEFAAQFSLLPEDFWHGGCDVLSPNDACDLGFDVDDSDRITLDFAHYDLAPGDRAFGVNLAKFEGYAGGGGTYFALTLLRAEGERLVQILTVPVGVHKNLAGDFNTDGSRERNEFATELLLRMLPSANAKANIALAPRGGTARLFEWDANLGAYRCHDR
ncbi:MAG: hypothetical protein QM756_35815 [Polyangiaceae bacterium]